LADDLEQDVEEGLAIVLEHCIQRRFFIELRDQRRSVETFDCTQQQYDNKLVTAAVIEAAITSQAAFNVIQNRRKPSPS